MIVLFVFVDYVCNIEIIINDLVLVIVVEEFRVELGS